jgi:hypothetical protein
MFPETYGRTLEELAFLFEDQALAEEATKKVEKQMEWSADQRWSRMDERMSWDMDVIIPNKSGLERREVLGQGVRGDDGIADGNVRAIRGERGGWWED